MCVIADYRGEIISGEGEGFYGDWYGEGEVGVGFEVVGSLFSDFLALAGGCDEVGGL